MSNETAVATIDVQGTQIEQYGQRAVVRELVGRLMSLHPAAAEVGKQGMMAVAQLAVMIGANPIPSTNEIHVWKDKRGKITIDLGINYFRRRGNELGGVYWAEDPRPMTADEYELYGINASHQIGAICKAARMDKIRELIQMGIPFADALKGVSRVGIGTVSNGATAKAGKPISWTALKGAEKDVHRALFPNLEQPPAADHWLEVVPNGGDHGDYEGETLSAEEAETLSMLHQVTNEATATWESATPEEQQERFEKAKTVLTGSPEFDGFDTPEPEPPQPPPAPKPSGNGDGQRPLSPEKVRTTIRKKANWQGDTRLMDGEPITEKQVGMVAGSLGHLFPNLSSEMRDKARYDVMQYLISGDITSTKKLTKLEASALIDWANSDVPAATAEASQILAAVAVEAGQIELELESA